MKQNIARAIRGGSWSNLARYCRSAFHYQSQPDDRYGNLGFRITQVSE